MARHPMMSFIHLTARAGVFAAVLIGFAPHAFAACASPAEFGRWLQGFKKEAVAQGISPQTVSYALDGLSYDPATIAKDRGQGVFAQSFLQFSGRMVSSNRLQVGGALLKKYADTFRRIEQQYGVPGPVLVAFWGLETDFGKVMGNMETMRSLATLSFDCRRPEEFQEQLIYALRVIERGDLTPAQMRGPAHGEVGQFQFQPKNYYEFGVDFDGDGRIDLVKSAPDSLASAANYLQSKGWRANQPWLEQVSVPADLPWDQADVTIKKPRAFWAQHGVTYLNGKPIPADDLPVRAGAAHGPERARVPRLSEFRHLSRLEPVAGLHHHGGLLRDAACRRPSAQPRQCARPRASAWPRPRRSSSAWPNSGWTSARSMAWSARRRAKRSAPCR